MLPRALALALLVPVLSHAADVWTDPAPGIRHLSRTTTGPLEYDALVVDLCDPSIELRATRSEERRQTVSTWARSVGAIAAINGDFFNYSGYGTIGLAVGSGAAWPGSTDGALEAVFAFGTGGRTEIRDGAEALGAPESWMREVVSGRPNCLVAGTARAHTDIHFDELHPRSALGLSADRSKLYMLVIDGRSSRSVGVKTQKVGEILRDLGAHDGLNLDGGGSSALWATGEGVVNRPSDGQERVVANHLGVVRVTVPEGEPSRCCTPRAVAGSTGSFGDLPTNHFARPAAEALLAAGITRGCQQSPPLFCPDCRVTRAMAVALLMRASGVPLTAPSSARFSDVPVNHTFFREIEAAAREGVTSGCGGGRFCPDEPASRATVAIFTARMMGLSTAQPAQAPFDDVPRSHAAAGAIHSLVGACVVRGCSADRFCADRTTTRAEMAVFTARAAGLVATPCTPVEPPDAGTPVVDAGTPEPRDAGSPPPVDAGTPPPRDAGPQPIDAGPPPIDAGPQPIDAGVIVDAGSTTRDAGSPDPEPDASEPPDASEEADAGDQADSGDRTDAGAGRPPIDAGDDVELPPAHEGCGCGSSPSWSALLLAVVVRRRARATSRPCT